MDNLIIKMSENTSRFIGLHKEDKRIPVLHNKIFVDFIYNG